MNLSQTMTQWPMVTIQLPVYNEKYVVERLIDEIIKIDYPSDKLEIQVLDDSTDETTELIAQKIASLADKFDIKHIRRQNRLGYKAGALQFGLEQAKGDFIAIFDADFTPDADFLKVTVPLFQNPKLGMVQTRWEHLNEHFSLLTRLQAFGLDAHFFIEQTGRKAGDHLINFNGTAGIWRKTCILDAGAWSADTLTEDLDLSYRAQLKGWEFDYLREKNSPAELPMTINAIKSQQYRWMKGGAECFVKNIGKVWEAKLPLTSKLQATFHLMNSAVFVVIMNLAFSSLFLVLNTDIFSKYHSLIQYTALFQVNWLILAVFYWLSFKRKHQSVFKFIGMFALFLIFMLGMSLHNSLAVIEAWIGRKTPFVRTPKFNLEQSGLHWKENRYHLHAIPKLAWAEMSIAILFFIFLFLDTQKQLYGMIPFHLMTFLGFFLVSFWGIKQAFIKN